MWCRLVHVLIRDGAYLCPLANHSHSHKTLGRRFGPGLGRGGAGGPPR